MKCTLYSNTLWPSDVNTVLTVTILSIMLWSVFYTRTPCDLQMKNARFKSLHQCKVWIIYWTHSVLKKGLTTRSLWNYGNVFLYSAIDFRSKPIFQFSAFNRQAQRGEMVLYILPPVTLTLLSALCYDICDFEMPQRELYFTSSPFENEKNHKTQLGLPKHIHW